MTARALLLSGDGYQWIVKPANGSIVQNDYAPSGAALVVHANGIIDSIANYTNYSDRWWSATAPLSAPAVYVKYTQLSSLGTFDTAGSTLTTSYQLISGADLRLYVNVASSTLPDTWGPTVKLWFASDSAGSRLLTTLDSISIGCYLA